MSSTRAAEMVKLLENTFRAVNIGLVNELALMCRDMGINVWEVIDAAKTKPFGFMPFYPGPGLGGHCIPIDPFYLSWKARQYRLREPLHRAGRPHQRRHAALRRRARGRALNTVGKAIKGSRVHLFGLAYKPDVTDCARVAGHRRRRAARAPRRDRHLQRPVRAGPAAEHGHKGRTELAVRRGDDAGLSTAP